MAADPTGLPLPRRDEEITLTIRLTLSGNRVRLERSSSKDGDWLEVFDGQRTTRRFRLNGKDQPPTIIVESPSAKAAMGETQLLPVIAWCRPIGNTPFRKTSDALTETDVDGIKHPTIQVRSGDSTNQTYVLDAGQGNLLRQIRNTTDKSAEVTDIVYVEHPQLVWAPNGWSRTKTGLDGKLLERSRTRVTEIQLDAGANADFFQITPVRGESVYDQESKRSFRVLDNGQLEEVDTTPHAQQQDQQRDRARIDWPGSSLVRYVLLPGLVVLIVLGVVMRLRQRARTDKSKP